MLRNMRTIYQKMFESLLIIAIILSFLSIPCNVPDGAVYMSFSMPKKYTYYLDMDMLTMDMVRFVCI